MFCDKHEQTGSVGHFCTVCEVPVCSVKVGEVQNIVKWDLVIFRLEVFIGVLNVTDEQF